jgi:hypothetical protein
VQVPSLGPQGSFQGNTAKIKRNISSLLAFNMTWDDYCKFYHCISTQRVMNFWFIIFDYVIITVISQYDLSLDLPKC